MLKPMGTNNRPKRVNLAGVIMQSPESLKNCHWVSVITPDIKQYYCCYTDSKGLYDGLAQRLARQELRKALHTNFWDYRKAFDRRIQVCEAQDKGLGDAIQ